MTNIAETVVYEVRKKSPEKVKLILIYLYIKHHPEC